LIVEISKGRLVLGCITKYRGDLIKVKFIEKIIKNAGFL